MAAPQFWVVAASGWEAADDGAVQARVSGTTRHLTLVGGPLCGSAIKRPAFGHMDDPVAPGVELPVCTACTAKATRLATSWGVLG